MLPIISRYSAHKAPARSATAVFVSKICSGIPRIISFLVTQSHYIWQRPPSGVKKGGSSSPLLDGKFRRRNRTCLTSSAERPIHLRKNDVDGKFAVRRARLFHRGCGEVRDDAAGLIARQSSRTTGDAAGHGLFPDGADKIRCARTARAVRLLDQGIVDERAFRISSDPRPAGLRRVSEKRVSRDVRARGV